MCALIGLRFEVKISGRWCTARSEMDNYATHKHPDVKAWLASHSRFHLHFTPTSSSWLNLVERWFRELTDKALRRGSFNSVPDLIAAIEDYTAAGNDNLKPFVWTATTDSMVAKVRRGRVALAVNTPLDAATLAELPSYSAPPAVRQVAGWITGLPSNLDPDAAVRLQAIRQRRP